jgi:hypothetical protein
MYHNATLFVGVENILDNAKNFSSGINAQEGIYGGLRYNFKK